MILLSHHNLICENSVQAVRIRLELKNRQIVRDAISLQVWCEDEIIKLQNIFNTCIHYYIYLRHYFQEANIAAHYRCAGAKRDSRQHLMGVSGQHLTLAVLYSQGKDPWYPLDNTPKNFY
jgi:hypothetical protein